MYSANRFLLFIFLLLVKCSCGYDASTLRILVNSSGWVSSSLFPLAAKKSNYISRCLCRSMFGCCFSRSKYTSPWFYLLHRSSDANQTKKTILSILFIHTSLMTGSLHASISVNKYRALSDPIIISIFQNTNLLPLHHQYYRHFELRGGKSAHITPLTPF